MARLQDFSDVTPSSSSDKLLIVQSAGQGLATLDTAGQQIANNTSVSQLHTTSKTLAGAINEHDSEIGSLSTLTTTDKSSIVGAVNEVNTNKSNTLLVERKSEQVTMDNYYKSVTISLTKTGYTAIGIVGYQTNTVGVVCFRNNIEGTNAVVGLVNRDGSTALGTNVDLYIDVLYLKN